MDQSECVRELLKHGLQSSHTHSQTSSKLMILRGHSHSSRSGSSASEAPPPRWAEPAEERVGGADGCFLSERSRLWLMFPPRWGRPC